MCDKRMAAGEAFGASELRQLRVEALQGLGLGFTFIRV